MTHRSLGTLNNALRWAGKLPKSLGSQSRQANRPPRGTRVLQVFGPIFDRPGILSAFYGGCVLQDLRAAINAAADDPGVERVVLDIDSMGGELYGLDATADVIAAAAKRKPIIAAVNSVCEGAAFWLASAASEIAMTQGGEVGGVGIAALHVDESRAIAKQGFIVTLLASTPQKVAGNSYEPHSPLGREVMQRRVDDYYAAFVRKVAKGRRTSTANVEMNYGEGGMFRAERAKRL